MDPRIEQIERSQVYGLFDRGVLIYVGQTKLPLKTRLRAHRAEAGADPPIYQYLDRHVHNPKEDLQIRVLSEYESEEEVLADLSDSMLNHDRQTEAEGLKYKWTSQKVDRLEEMVDEYSFNRIGEELDIHPRQVRNAAVKLGLAEITSRSIDWEKWEDKLGTMCDRELAEMIGCSITAVKYQRDKLGIHPYGRIKWEDWDHLLGEIPDTELAEKIGTTAATVKDRRQKLGIDPHKPRRILSDTDVLKIRVRYAENPDETYPSLASEYGLNRQTIGRVVRGNLHSDLPMPEDLTEEEKEDLLELSHN